MERPSPQPHLVDPGDCAHGRSRRLGIQRVPWKPYRIHLVLCELCGTTLSTEQLRIRRRSAAESARRA